MTFLIVLALLGVLTGAIAHSKGRSFFGWFVYGALLFIVAIVHVLIIAPLRPALDARQIDQGGRQCPHCAEIIRREAKVCRFCGRDVGAQD